MQFGFFPHSSSEVHQNTPRSQVNLCPLRFLLPLVVLLFCLRLPLHLASIDSVLLPTALSL